MLPWLNSAHSDVGSVVCVARLVETQDLIVP